MGDQQISKDAQIKRLARELVRGSIIEDAASRFVEMVLKEAHDSRIKPLQDRIEELEAKLADAVEEKLDAISTLDAWFDRRKLAHDAVDQAVIDAASGYLRTSRVGGMSQKDSDLVLAVIQDMARLSLFADLFARAALAEIKEKDDE